jgi:hypothetical protein
MKVVLFLGAGFSKAFELPAMEDFFGYAQEADYLDKDQKAFLDNLQREASNGASMLSIPLSNMEDVLSFCLASRLYSSGYPSPDNENYQKLCRILMEIYRRVENQHFRNIKGRLKPLQGLLGYPEYSRTDSIEYDCTIITTNYDVMAEYCFERMGMKCKLPMEWENFSKKNDKEANLYSDKESAPLICKLHGSVNWFQGSNNDKVAVEGGLAKGDYDTDDFETDSFDENQQEITRIIKPRICFDNFRSESAPLILPPSVFKVQTPSWSREIWTAAGEALAHADKVIFIGFSFPTTDTHIRYFLGANLAGNIRLKELAIIDPLAKTIYERLDSTAPENLFGNEFKKKLKPFVGKWQDSNYSVIPDARTLSIIEAKFGIEEQWYDVTEKLSDKVIDNMKLEVIASKTIFGDPAKGLRKKLIVTYRIGSKGKTTTVEEEQRLLLP